MIRRMRKTNVTLTLACAWALTILFASAALGQTRAAAPTRCNDAPASPVSYVPLPGHPFSTVTSPDGCWLFVSLTTANPKSYDGVALLRRSQGKVELVKFFPVAGSPTGMTLTHDGKLLVVADGDYVVFMDTGRMTAGAADPVLGYISDGDFPGSVYVNTTADDRLLFVSDESAEVITVIDLARARAEGFKETAI